WVAARVQVDAAEYPFEARQAAAALPWAVDQALPEICESFLRLTLSVRVGWAEAFLESTSMVALFDSCPSCLLPLQAIGKKQRLRQAKGKASYQGVRQSF